MTNIFVGQAKVQESGKGSGKYFIYLPAKRLEAAGGGKGYEVIYRIEVGEKSDSKPRGMFLKAKEGDSPFKKKEEVKVENGMSSNEM